jgi:ATP-dependent Clp protease ATP-binding subunit ClpC
MDWFEEVKSELDRRKQHQNAEAEFWSDFTPRVRRVFDLALQEARQMHCTYIGVEHLLIGLMSLGDGVAVNILKRAGLTLENLRAEVQRRTFGEFDSGMSGSESLPGRIPFTPRAKRVLGLAKNEATALNHTYTGTEHLLLGLLAERDGMVWHICKDISVNREEMRRLILEEIMPKFP